MSRRKPYAPSSPRRLQRRIAFFEHLEPRALLAPMTLTGLPFHTVTVDGVPDARIISTAPNPQLTFSITRGADTTANHDITITAAHNNDGQSLPPGVAEVDEGDPSNSIPLTVNVGPGSNTFEITLERTAPPPTLTVVVAPPPPQPPLAIRRNRVVPNQTVQPKDTDPPQEISLKDPDADDNAMVTITSLPSDGELQQKDGTPISVGDPVTDPNRAVLFIPERDSTGTRTFTFRANDTFEVRNGTITIEIQNEPPAPPGRPDLLSDTGPSFVANASGDDFTRGLPEQSSPANRFLTFEVQGVQPGATVRILRDGVAVGPAVTNDDDDKVTVMMVPVGTTGTFAFTARQTDMGGSSSDSAPLPVTIDLLDPDAKNFRLTEQQASNLPVPIVVNASPTVRFELTEQIFAGENNRVQLRLFDHATNVQLGSTREESFQEGSQGTRTIDMPAPLGSLTGERTIRLEATDTANNIGSFLFTIFVLDVGEATVDAPNTPVFSTLFYVGAELTRPAAAATPTASQKVIFVDREIPVGFTLNIEDVAGSQPKSYIVNQVTLQPEGDFRLTLDKNLSRAYSTGQRMAWLRPWTQTFDKTTQTTWFTMEDGHRLGQFDPATQEIRLFDVNFQGGSGTSALDPHGVFFDFNTHLTPRVWFVYRNENDPDTPEPVDETARVAYLDLATGQLVTFDFATLDLERNGQHVDLEAAHNIQVDDQGTVWMTIEHANGMPLNAIVELDFDLNLDGSPTSSLNSRQGRVIVHTPPAELGAPFDFAIHGLQITVDQRTGERYVWFSDAQVSTAPGRIALLRPGQPATAGRPQTQDAWFEWNLDEALIAEGRYVPNDPMKTPDGHVLFIAIDDRETPGTPEDDLVVFGDSGIPRDPEGLVRVLDPSNVIRALQQGKKLNELPENSPVRSVRIPKLPGARPEDEYAATVQSLVDREGNIFFLDVGGGVGRFNPDDPRLESNTPAPRINAPFKRDLPNSPIEIAAISMTATANALVPAEIIAATTQFPIVSDHSSSTGVDQYETAATSQRRSRSQGPFRGTQNAGSVVYGSLAESDYISTTVFAETVRRQMDVVVSPGTPQNGLTQGRIAFSVRRDGSLIATLRADGKILDEHLNLSELEEGSNPSPRFRFDGEPSAAINNSTGVVTVFGINQLNNLIVYQFNGGMNGWTNASLTSEANWTVSEVVPPAPSLLIGEPAAFIDSTGQAAAIATSQNGDMLYYNPRLSPALLNLNNASSGAPVFSSVAVLNPPAGSSQAGQVLVYGTNQAGQLIQFAFADSAIPVAVPGTVVPTTDRPAGQSARDVMVFQGVYARIAGDVRHIFAVDGNSRLVHFEINPVAGTTKVENVTALTQANGNVFGYFPFQQSLESPFGGRVYTELAPEISANGTIFVYGTNGGELIEFQRPAGGAWQVANLTNDIYSTSGRIDGPNRGGFNEPPAERVSANAVFGAPTAYVVNGERHILQVNGDGEVVEYYFQNVEDSFGRFQTQNVTLRLAPTGVNDVYRTGLGQTLVVSAPAGVLANDKNPTNLAPKPPLTAFQVTAPANGTVTFNENDGSFSYTPKAGFVGTDTFFYQAKSEFAESPKVLVTIIVEAPVVGTIIDDGRPGYSQKGSWPTRSDPGSFQGDFRENAKGKGKDVATWSFTKLPAGEYEVFTRWSAAPTRATNAPYAIFDNTRVVGGQLVNQRQQPEGEQAAGFVWKSLGTVRIESGTLKVTLTDKANGTVIADAVRVVRRSLETTLDDGTFGYTQRGSWQTRKSSAGVRGDFRESAKGSGRDVAEWKFTELADGNYEVFTHWVAGANRASNAPYSVFDNNLKLDSQSVNQKVAPADEIFGGFRWHSLGTVNITSGVLKVTLNDKANGVVIADAVRIEPLGNAPLMAFDAALLSLMSPPEAQTSSQPLMPVAGALPPPPQHSLVGAEGEAPPLAAVAAAPIGKPAVANDTFANWIDGKLQTRSQKRPAKH